MTIDWTDPLEVIRYSPAILCARWWVIMNDWGWPDDLPGKPGNFDELVDPKVEPNKFTILKPLMQACVVKAGKTACLMASSLRDANQDE